METDNRNLLDKALGFACIAHSGQFRKDGKTPYIVHPIEVMRFLQNQCQIRDDDELLAAALLHDIMEDCTVSESIISENFNNRISGIVAELTIVESSKQEYLDSFPQKSNEAVIIKCADRICNSSDYMFSGDFGYAKVYLEKAIVVFQELSKPERNIKASIVDRIYSVYTTISNRCIDNMMETKIDSINKGKSICL